MKLFSATGYVGYALRSLRRSPGFTAVAVSTAAIGIGGTVAVFALVNAWLLRPLPYAYADRLVHLRGQEAANYAVVRTDFRILSERSRTIEEAAVLRPWSVTLRQPDGTLTRRSAASVSWNYFRLLGIRPVAGRFFLPGEGANGAPVVVLSHAAWQRELGGRAAPIGGPLTVDGVTYTVIGVAPRSFADPIALDVLGWEDGPAMWRPIPPDYGSTENAVAYWVIGRRRAATPPAGADAEVRAIFRGFYPEWEERPHRLAGFRDVRATGTRSTLLLLLAGAGLLLLISAVNLGNLLLSRAVGRRDELAVRASLGATRRRLLGQVLVESLVLALAGGVGGTLVAKWAVDLLAGTGGYGLPGPQEIGLDVRVLLFAALTCLVMTVAAGTLPALRSAGLAVGADLRGGGRGSVSTEGERLRRLLVTGQTAMAVVLLASAGLLSRSLWNFAALDPGFEPRATLTARVSLSGERYDSHESQATGLDGVIRRLEGLPGVGAVGAVSDLPMSGAINSTAVRRAPGDERGPTALVRTVAGPYFRAMEIPVLRGREFGVADGPTAPPVALLDRALAERLFPGEDALGRRVTVRGVEREIVGVVGNVVQFDLGETPQGTLYTPYAQEREEWMRSAMTLVVRGPGDPETLAAPIRAAIRDHDPAIPMYAVRSLAAYVREDLVGPRSRAAVVATFATTAIFLAASGLGGVLSFAVSRRRREIGLRMALGAGAGRVTRAVVWQAARVVGIGLVAGLAGAWIAGRAMSGFLFGVAPSDPAVLAVVVLLLGAIALVAAYVPARQAASVSPAEVLRAQ